MILESKIVTRENAKELSRWCKGVLVKERSALEGEIGAQPGINVPVGDGAKRASVKDMIVRHDDGSFDVYKA